MHLGLLKAVATGFAERWALGGGKETTQGRVGNPSCLVCPCAPGLP